MAKFGIGQAVRRVEDQRFITGAGRYVDDIVLPGMCHGVNLLSPHAHARIKSIDVSKAKAAPGVVLVLTGADVAADHIGAFTAGLMPEDVGAPKGHRIFQQVLQAEKLRMVGEMAAGIAHNFNNVLTTILTRAQILALQGTDSTAFSTCSAAAHRRRSRASPSPAE